MKYNTPQEILAWIVQKKDDLPTTASKSEGRLLHGIIRELQSNIHISQKDTTEHIEEIIKDTNRETVFRCRFCGSEHRVYKLYFSISHLEILKKIYIYCINNKTNTFNKKDLDLTHTEYGNFPFLKRFGLIYLERPGKEKTYGAPVRRINQFFKGEWAVAEYSSKDTKSKMQEVSEKRIYIDQIKKYDKGKFITNMTPYFIQYDILEKKNIL